MWHHRDRDCPFGEAFIHKKVDTGRGRVGYEMHELNGRQETQQPPCVKKEGFLQLLKRF